MEYANLGDLRKRLLHFSPAAVSRFTAIALPRLQAIEAGEAPTVHEAEQLGEVYGIDPDLLMDEPITLDPGDAISTLALLDEFQEVSAETRRAIISAATAARDLVQLKARLGEPDPWEGFVGSFRLAKARDSDPPFAQGRHYAVRLRSRLELGKASIASMRDLVQGAFGSVAVLYADLQDSKLAGVTFADRFRGPTIVLNTRGKNENPGVRRFSLAHELCHLLVDTDRIEPLATLSGFLSDEGLVREQRANAFATRLLCPEEVVRALPAVARSEPFAAARALIEEYGMHYQAARLYLRNVTHLDLPPHPPHGLIGAELGDRWHLAEEPSGLSQFPVSDVPPVRRTEVAMAAAKLYAAQKIGRDAFSRLLGVTPVHEVERVLGYFGLDLPEADVPR